MFKRTQTIRRLLPTNYSTVFSHFVGLSLKMLKSRIWEFSCFFLQIHGFFYKQSFYKQHQAEIGKKDQVKAKQHPEAELSTKMS